MGSRAEGLLACLELAYSWDEKRAGGSTYSKRAWWNKKGGKGGKKAQAVVLHLLKRLPIPPLGSGYHVFLDNLFVSTRFIEYARSQGIAVTGTCHDSSGVIQELLDLTKKDKKDVIPLGKTYSIATEDGQVCLLDGRIKPLF